MKKIYFLGALLCLTTILLAQETFVSFEPLAKKPRISALLANTNQTGILGISYHFNGKLIWNAVDKAGQVIEKRGLSVGSTRIQPKGAIHTDTHFFHFYKDMDNHNLKIIRATKEGKAEELLQRKVLGKKERFIGIIADKNIFCLLMLNKKEKGLKVVKFNVETEQFDETVFPLKEYMVDKLHKVQFMALKSADLIGPQQAAAALKLYVLTEDKLLLTLDGAKAKGYSLTELITLDLATKELTNQAVGKNGYELNGRTKSLLFKGQIYNIAATREKLTIGIYNLSDLSLQKEYNFTKEEKVDIMDSPFFTESDNSNGFYLFNPARKAQTIAKPATKKLFKKLSVGAPFIIASTLNKEQTLLTIGTHIVTNGGGGYFSPGMGGGTINTPNGPVSMPSTPGTWVGGMGSGYQQARFFYTLVNANDWEHVDAKDSMNKTVQPVQQFVDKTLTNKHIHTVIPYGGKTAVVHYLRSDKQIKVVLIE